MRLRSGVAIDLGTVNTLVYVAGRGIVIDEPTAIAISRESGGIVAVGQAADALAGKEPHGIEVVHPLRAGVIADLDATVAILQEFLRRARVRRRLAKTVAIVCLPVEVTVVEQRSLVAAVAALRPRCAVRLVEEPVAAAAGAGFDLLAGSGAFVVDIGGGTTDIAVLAGGHLVRARSLRVGGDDMDDAVARAVKREHGLLIGRNAARNLKMTLGLADGALSEAEVVGIDAAGRTPRTERVSARLISAAIEPAVASITATVREMLSDIPPNLAEDVVHGKIRLSGGGALLPGLAYRVEAEADIATVVVEDPLRCVIRGAAQILEVAIAGDDSTAG
jgi:rod shape-determining protein MreB and related proteins